MTTTPDSAAQGGVVQADREAAAAFYDAHLSRSGEVPVAAAMRMRHIDESPLIQAFAAHRLASSPPAQQAGVEDDPLRNTSPGVLEDGRTFVEHWRGVVKIASRGHDMAANINTIRRMVAVIDSLDSRLRAALRPSTDAAAQPTDAGVGE